MKKRFILWGVQQLLRATPEAVRFLKTWWWALLAAAMAMLGLGVWLTACALMWLWNALPHILTYIVGHFTPLWEANNIVLPTLPMPATVNNI